MSKQLEKEYRSLIAEDAPDLWGRIEAGLEPKQPVRKKGTWRKYRTWGAVAAACICLMLAVPVGINQMTGGKNSATDSAPSAWENMSGGAADDGVLPESVMWDADQNMTNEATAVPGEEEKETEEQAAAGFTITAKVLELSETENRIAYTVQVEETDCGEFSNGEQIILYDERMPDMRLEEGETYRLRITVRTDGNGTVEYLLQEISFQ